VSSSSESVSESSLEAIARPLRFAAKNGFRNLPVIKNLERSLADAIARAQAAAERTPDEARTLEAIGRLVAGLDETKGAERERRVRGILDLIDGSEPAAPDARSCRDDLRAKPEAETAEGHPPTEMVGGRRGRSAIRAGPRAESSPRRRSPLSEDRGPNPSIEEEEPGGAGPVPRARSSARRGRVAPGEAEPATLLAAIAGVGPKTSVRLAARGLRTVADALLFLPRRYDDRTSFTPIAKLRQGEHANVRGTITQFGRRFAGPGRRVFEIAVKDETGTLSCRWFRFHQAAMEKRFERGQAIVVSGSVSLWGQMRQIVHPEIELLAGEGEARPQGLVPIYAEVEGVPAKTLRKILIELVRGAASKLDDPLPPALRARLRLPPLDEAVRAAHDPDPDPKAKESIGALRRRLVFDELFFLQLALATRRRDRDDEPGYAHPAAGEWRALSKAMLPFPLTAAQERALDEIAADLASPRPMNRLLQGDVGSGKTAVAFVAARIAIASKRQAALLVPTEILAAQHAETASRIFGDGDVRVGLLTGSTRAADRRRILFELRAGTIDLVIGTHALLEPDVEFKELGLAIVDEQHRFGVEQRALLRDKGRSAKPDTLVMTATPIPRTLALTCYGDLRVSIIDALPPGRKPTATHLVAASDRARAHRIVDEEIAKGRQAYVVYPLVEASEKIDLQAATEAVEELRARFHPHRVEVLHGRMSAFEKADVMERFKANEVRVLVSTTVIEVGVDVANATVMLVEHAERFGLSQIHQLRGRVGRGTHAGICVLVAAAGGPEVIERLSVLEATNDGFKVAEQDLAQRGPGEMLGTRQAGLPDLILADLVRDARTLEEARTAAFDLIASDPALGAHVGLRGELERRFEGRLGLADVG
jgi:ATP-dependent DNA helicase RecG